MTSHMHGQSQAMAPSEGDRLLTLLDRQHALALELDALSREQEAASDVADPADLVTIMARRQVLVDELVRQEALIVALGGAMREGTARQRGQEIAALLEGVRARDESSRRVLEARRDAIAKELVELSAGKRATGAYGPRAGGGPRFQDREA